MLLLTSQAKIRGRCAFCLDHIVEKLRIAEEKTSAQMHRHEWAAAAKVSPLSHCALAILIQMIFSRGRLLIADTTHSRRT